MVRSRGSMPSGHDDAEEVSQLLGAGAEPEPHARFGFAGHFATLRALSQPEKPSSLASKSKQETSDRIANFRENLKLGASNAFVTR